MMNSRSEMLDIVTVDGRARGIVTRDLVTGAIESHAADAVVLATGGYGNVFYLSTNARGCNVTASWRAHRRGAAFANPCFTQIHPTCIPVSGDYQSKLTLMSESLRNDGRVWVPFKAGDQRAPGSIPEAERDYYLERKYPSFGNLAPRDIASRAAKEVCDEGRGVGPGGRGVYLDFAASIQRLGEAKIAERYGNLFDMYQRITDENPYQVPMRIYPAVHYTMGGLWVDYNLMSTVPGAARAGRGELLRSRGQPAGRECADAGAGRRLLRHPAHDRRLPRQREAGAGGHRSPGVQAGRGGGWRAHQHAAGLEGTTDRRLVPPRAGQDHVGEVRHGAHRVGAQGGARADSGAAGRVLERCAGAGHGGRAQPVAGAGGPGGRLPRAGRADVPRRAGARGVVRRPLPGGAPDRGRRGEAGRLALLLCRRVGVGGRGHPAAPQQGSRWTSRT